MKSILITFILLLSISGLGQTHIQPTDLKMIIGTWEGNITYLDYQTNKPFSMPALLTVSPGKNDYTLDMKTSYPNEPKANNSDKIKVTKDGSRLNKNAVTQRKELENGRIQIQTEHWDTDDQKKAQIKYTYLISLTHFSIQKEVRFENTTHWIKRNEYHYQRK